MLAPEIRMLFVMPRTVGAAADRSRTERDPPLTELAQRLLRGHFAATVERFRVGPRADARPHAVSHRSDIRVSGDRRAAQPDGGAEQERGTLVLGPRGEETGQAFDRLGRAWQVRE